MLWRIANEKWGRLLLNNLWPIFCLCLDESDNFQGTYLRVRGEPLGKMRCYPFIRDLSWPLGDCWLWTDTNSRKPKSRYGQPVRAGPYGGQMTNRVLSQIPLTVGPVVSRPVLLLFFSGRHNLNRWTMWQNPHKECSSGKVQVGATLLICLADPGDKSIPTTVSFY